MNYSIIFTEISFSPETSIRVDISSGSASLTASQLIEQEALSRKNAAEASNALSMAEYIQLPRYA